MDCQHEHTETVEYASMSYTDAGPEYRIESRTWCTDCGAELVEWPSLEFLPLILEDTVLF